MPIVTASLVLVGLLSVLNLILALGIIKRLREHTELLSRRAGSPTEVTVGEQVGAFSTTTVDGEALSHESWVAGTLVGFFSPNCEPCRDKLPEFVRYARSVSEGPESVLAVVIGDLEEAAGFVTDLAPVAKVVVEDSHNAPVSAAFKVSAYPTMLVVAPGDEGRLVVEQDRVDLGRPTVAAV